MDNLSKREQNKRQARQNIISAAFKLFQKNGYRQTTLADIANAAGVSPRTIFNYFPSKESIVFYDHDGIFEDLKTELNTMHTPVISILQSFVRAIQHESTHDQLFTNRMYLITSNDELLEYLSRTHLELEAVVQHAIASELGLPDTALLPKLAAACIRASITHVSECETKAVSFKAIEETLRFIEAGLATAEK